MHNKSKHDSAISCSALHNEVSDLIPVNIHFVFSLCVVQQESIK